jgi:hypothetical protein
LRRIHGAKYFNTSTNKDITVEKVKITKDFCKDKIVLFYPQSKTEVQLILDRAFGMGIYWITSHDKTGGYDIKKSIETGLYIKEGCLRHSPNQSIKDMALVCTGAQFDEPFDFDTANPANLSDRDLLIALFNKVSALTEKVESLQAEIAPKHLQKDSLKIK